METFRLGGRDVGRLGFGAMQLPTGPAERAGSVAVARRAVELGVTLIDTAHLYGWGANEELLAEALFPYPPEVLVTTKVGIRRVRPVADATSAGTAGSDAVAAGVVELAAVAAEVGASVAQVSLAWLLHRSPVVLPIPGTSSLAHLKENVAAADVRLTADQQARLDALAG